MKLYETLREILDMTDKQFAVTLLYAYLLLACFTFTLLFFI